MIRALDVWSFSPALCQTLSWFAFSRTKGPSKFRCSCCARLAPWEGDALAQSSSEAAAGKREAGHGGCIHSVRTRGPFLVSGNWCFQTKRSPTSAWVWGHCGDAAQVCTPPKLLVYVTDLDPFSRAPLLLDRFLSWSLRWWQRSSLHLFLSSW